MKFGRFALSFVWMFFLLTACNLSAAPRPTPGNPNAVFTAAAQTVEARLTQSALLLPATPPLSTPLPTATFAPLEQNLNPLSPATALPTPVTPPDPSAPCDAARFVADVTVPDGTPYSPGAAFVKTWRLQNIGSCTWTTAYALVFSGGERMNGAAAVNLPAPVAPGQFVDVSITLKAPDADGRYTGYWMLRNAAGLPFGLGENAQKPFFVTIKVVGDMTTVFDFVSEYCRADWRSGAGVFMLSTMTPMTSPPASSAPMIPVFPPPKMTRIPRPARNLPISRAARL